jgi:hypothetical protein
VRIALQHFCAATKVTEVTAAAEAAVQARQQFAIAWRSATPRPYSLCKFFEPGE